VVTGTTAPGDQRGLCRRESVRPPGRRGVMADSSITDLSKGKRITGDDRTSLADELRERYDGGESIRSLATSTNRSYGFVHRLLSESGASLRGRGGANRNAKKTA
jgi:hypothetical protein